MITEITKEEIGKISGGNCRCGHWLIPESGGFFDIPNRGNLTLAYYYTRVTNTVYVYCDGHEQTSLSDTSVTALCAKGQQVRLQCNGGAEGEYWSGFIP